MAKKKKSSPETTEVEVVDENVEIETSTEESSTESNESDEASNHEELTLMLEDARAKADEHWNQVLRSNAELENTRRRARQDVENAHKFALEKFALELLPVKDSLEMGLAAVNTDEGDATAQLKEGAELTLKMLASAMGKFGIEAMGSEGEPFNPEFHQAMSMQESAEHAPNTVMAVMQKGYQLNDRLIRPAMVVVSKAAAAEEEK
jgi:molecular chaperone GrpE